MNIIINALSAKLGGGQTYILNFLRYAGPENEIYVLVGPFNAEKFRSETEGKPHLHLVVCSPRLQNSLYRTIWERWSLPKLLKKMKADVYFAAGGGTLTKVPRSCRSVTIVRNMLPFDQRERARFPLFSLLRLKLRLLQSIALYAFKYADRVIFISQYSFDRVSELAPKVGQKGAIIPHGLNEQFLHEADASAFDFSQFGLEPGKFYLYVSIFNYYKAQLELVREWKELKKAEFPYPLVLTGFMPPLDYTKQVTDLIAQEGLEKDVIVTGPVDYKRLPDYYAGARALVFASSCECCPNILLEEMSAGKPIFCSDIPPMPEFGGPDLYYFNPYQPGELAKVVLETEKDDSAMAECGRKAKERASGYRWEKTIKETIRFLTE